MYLNDKAKCATETDRSKMDRFAVSVKVSLAGALVLITSVFNQCLVDFLSEM